MACVLPDSDSARHLHSDLLELEVPALLFPESGHSPYDREHLADTAPQIRRADVLQQLVDGVQGVVVTSVEAAIDLLPSAEAVQSRTVTVREGDSVLMDPMLDELKAIGYIRVEFVQEPGELARRGGIVDVFPFAGSLPVRIEFYGDIVESIREFDAHTQCSVSQLSVTRLAPRPEKSGSEIPLVTLLECLPAETLLFIQDAAQVREKAQAAGEALHAAFDALPDKAGVATPDSLYLSPARFHELTASFAQIHAGSLHAGVSTHTANAGGRPHPEFAGQITLLREYLTSRPHITHFIVCDSPGQRERLNSLLERELDRARVLLLVASLSQGFELPQERFAVLTDHQIFGRYHRPRTRRRRRTGGIRIQELQSLKPGDFVVHVEYGIGKFAGFRTIDVKGRSQEAVRLHYADNDIVYVNVNALHKLNKYAGKDGQVPRLTRLGSGQWERAKQRAKRRIKDIARDLIQLYAKRKSSQGYSFSSDTVWQRELEAKFPWEETPDQQEAIEAVKRDMESSAPMDRLVCGDVGFGKTEVAIRAAFKAVQDGKQVAILVPTTVLARQHYLTFRRRLEPYPIRVEVLSRRVTGSAVRALLNDLAAGTVDVLVGTHRLVSKDVSFNDLGLLIIDEEQRFGVRMKEKLRTLRVNVDTLTLTATPIPRTLQFSLIGARDLSIINTAPRNRQPIQTEIHSVDWALIRDTILYEVSRGGQVFFIHNRVQSIDQLAAKLRDQLPDVRIAVGHGQMAARQLERVMTGFVDHRFDVLVSTTIVENGLDIGNANTIIIHMAHRFGLAELHQLRGRVGRSDRKAFCYLLVPSVHDLTRDSRQRLQAVEQFSDLGSGFQIAMRDLDIRGAGNILGGEQSGFIADLGLATYHKMLEEAVHELRTEEFEALFENQSLPEVGETTVDVNVNAALPKEFVSSDLERLTLYRRIAEARSQDALDGVEAEVRDRFGPLPLAAQHLLQAARLRVMGRALRLKRVQFRLQRLHLHLPDDQMFHVKHLQPLITALESLPNAFVLRPLRSGAMRIIVQRVSRLSAAVDILETLKRSTLNMQDDPV